MQNESGIRPVEYKVLIKPDPAFNEQKTAGGIIIPDDANERHQAAQVKGTLIAVGGKAFNDPTMWSDEEREDMAPGARIYFNKYQGIVLNGADGEEYRLCTDKDVGAIIEKEGALSVVKGRKPGGLGAA